MRTARAGRPAGTAAVQQAVYVNIFLVMLTLGVISPSLSDIRADLGVTYGAVSWAISIFAIGRLLGNLPAARLASSPARRRAELVAGTGLVGAGTLAAAVSPGLWGLLTGRAVAGLGSAAVATAGTLAVLDLAEEGERGKASGRYSAYLGSGALVGPALGGVLATVVGWRGALAVTGAALLVFTSLLAARVDRDALDVGDGPDPAGSPATRPALPRRAAWPPLACVAYALTFAVFWTRGAIQQATIPLLGGEELHMSSFEVSLVLLMCSGVATLGASRVGRRIDARGWQGTIPVLLGLMTAGALVVATAGTAVVLVAGAAVTAVGLSAAGAPASMVVDAVAPAVRARAVGWFRMIGDLALLGAPVATGWLADHAGFGPGAVLAAGVSGAVLVAVAVYARRPSGAASPVGELEVRGRDPQEAERDGAVAGVAGGALDEREEGALVDLHGRGDAGVRPHHGHGGRRLRQLGAGDRLEQVPVVPVQVVLGREDRGERDRHVR